MAALGRLPATHAGAGRVVWIGLRPARLADPVVVAEAEVTEAGLTGDHARAGRRAITLIQAEHLPVIAALCRRDHVAPDLLRRNIVVEEYQPDRAPPCKAEHWWGRDRHHRPVPALFADGKGAGPGRLQRHARPWRLVCRSASSGADRGGKRRHGAGSGTAWRIRPRGLIAGAKADPLVADPTVKCRFRT